MSAMANEFNSMDDQEKMVKVETFYLPLIAKFDFVTQPIGLINALLPCVETVTNSFYEYMLPTLAQDSTWRTSKITEKVIMLVFKGSAKPLHHLER